ncbi:hypothetical protein bcgnr5378_66510 [Bacillus cereus]
MNSRRQTDGHIRGGDRGKIPRLLYSYVPWGSKNNRENGSNRKKVIHSSIILRL